MTPIGWDAQAQASANFPPASPNGGAAPKPNGPAGQQANGGRASPSPGRKDKGKGKDKKKGAKGKGKKGGKGKGGKYRFGQQQAQRVVKIPGKGAQKGGGWTKKGK